MAFIDTSAGRDFIESFMQDTCAITRDAHGIKNDVLDRLTGRLYRPVGDIATIYSGPCLFRSPAAKLSFHPDTMESHGELRSGHRIRIMVPRSVTDVKVGDMATALSSVFDPRLVGRVFKIEAISEGTHSTYRALSGLDITSTIRTED